jgi:hypothetical protein
MWSVDLQQRREEKGGPVFGLVMLSTAIVAALLVVYFDWRAKVLSRIREQRYEGRKAA